MMGAAPAQIVAMLVENDQRIDLTESERAAGYVQLEPLGLDVAEVARRTGRAQKHVQSALKLTKLGEAATAAADAGKLSLEDVADLEEFGDDLKVTEKILKDVGSSWGIKHKVREERRTRQVKEAVAAVTAELEAVGVKIVEKPKEWPYNCAMARVDQLQTADGEEIDPEAVKAVDGYAAVIEERWDSAGAIIVCLDPEAHAYKRTGHSYYKSPAEVAAKEADDKVREERAAGLKESGAVRRPFLVEKYGSAKGANKLLVEAMRFAVVSPDCLQYRLDREFIKALAEGPTAGQDRLSRLLVARMIGAQEHNVEQVAEARWVAHKDLIVLWLNRLEEGGYELSRARGHARRPHRRGGAEARRGRGRSRAPGVRGREGRRGGWRGGWRGPGGAAVQALAHRGPDHTGDQLRSVSAPGVATPEGPTVLDRPLAHLSPCEDRWPTDQQKTRRSPEPWRRVGATPRASGAWREWCPA